MPKAYVVAEIQVSNPERYPDYQPLANATIEQYGGRWLVRGGKRDQVEGGDEQHGNGWRTVIVEFDSLQQARKWYDSAEYTEAKALRLAYSTGRLFLVEGV
ncbi:MAG: D-fructose-6-phosphate amidotransferase [Paucimonas sp.]|nr:D-fructose-6-phosphate amidotransferase [Paucimonas sp.]